MKKAIVISLVALLLNSAGGFVFAQTLSPATEKDFTTTYDAQMRQTLATFPDLPSIAVVVIKDNKPIFLRAYGMADREGGMKADIDTLYYIASSTKAFTALAAAMLDKEGKIKFSDALTKYTPGIRFKSDIPDKITIRDLLTHTSGLRNSPLGLHQGCRRKVRFVELRGSHLHQGCEIVDVGALRRRATAEFSPAFEGRDRNDKQVTWH